MRLEAPSWWYQPRWSVQAVLASPIALVFGLAMPVRFALARAYRSALPVVCIGNFTAGGAGKTPLAIAVAGMLQDMGASPAFLSRGYGGSLAGPHLVHPERDHAGLVGDEPLLLARHAPTVIARDRRAGARFIEAQGAGVIVMDDGFQNPGLEKDVALIAVDAAVGIGNGGMIPAGPLRGPLEFQVRRASAVMLIGDGDAGERLARQIGSAAPVLRARIEPDADVSALHGTPVVAFCAIGRPDKFFDILRASGLDVARTFRFPDHHVFTNEDATRLMEAARESGARLLTTQKDWLRMPDSRSPVGALKQAAGVVPIRLVLDGGSDQELRRILQAGLAQKRALP
jgi:tetraacyldisaccharide 4'-kinase